MPEPTPSQPDLDEFRDEVTTFLQANARPRPEDQTFVWGEGTDKVGLFDEKSRDEEERQLAAAQAWRARRFDAGLGWITGPAELGGRGRGAAHERLYA